MPDETSAHGSQDSVSQNVATMPPQGYELHCEIGRGGMGIVFRARDVALNREVAVKILEEQFAPDSSTARRFVEEVAITGQLQHPGIPPVYHVGQTADGRPFMAMKLIRGETLEELLKTRTRVNTLAVFEAICQAVGYAHAHDVIHRDLKPANVMVGAFGEVQVMDWGLAKVLSAKASEQPASGDPNTTTAPTEIRSGRDDSDGSFTQAGSVMGTPAYMAPEQAAGEIRKVDLRSDVFGLGAILCVLLTGKPPFGGRDADSVRLNAVRGRTEEALHRLDECGAEPEVVALCKQCLAFEPADRPASASEVARRIGELRQAAAERARQAELAQAGAEVQVAEQRKRRRALLVSGGAVVAVLLLGVADTTVGFLWADRARREAVEAQQAEEAARGEADAALQDAEIARKKAQERLAKAKAVGAVEQTREQVRSRLTVPSPFFLSCGFSAAVLDSFDVGHSARLGREVAPVYDDAGTTCVGFLSRLAVPRCRACRLCHHRHEPCRTGYKTAWRVMGDFPRGDYLYNYAAVASSSSRRRAACRSGCPTGRSSRGRARPPASCRLGRTPGPVPRSGCGPR
jgi:hypothetical protein